MKNFIYDAQPSHVIFGVGSLNDVKTKLSALGSKRAMVIATPEQVSLAQQVGGLLGDLCAVVHAEAVQHVPIESVDKALEIVQAHQVDGLVAAGGGSSVGLAKAIALKTSLPILAIPTTYAGSEMTPIWGITENGLKKTGRDPVVKPKTVIYDPELTVTLPKGLTVTSGMNAIAHCAEALYAENANPIISLLAEDGIRALAASLPKILVDPTDLDARADAQYGCWLGGMALGSVGMAMHHKLCHSLGGSYNLPHAETHTVVLPHVIAYNASHAPEAVKAIARALGTDESDVAGTLFDLAKSLNVPTSLEELGMKEEDLDEAAEIATENPYYNPRPIEKNLIRELLGNAFSGKRPTQVGYAVSASK
ncbi:maleylacetate reductase [Sporosarcina ureae]|uniref:maleylacetate reductase n=1 Tax=Sporosarcina ureae TaxID=1571 RepID=UPI0028AF7391|nr:maleylacetate reductase [Sporosarcina ureae]